MFLVAAAPITEKALLPFALSLAKTIGKRVFEVGVKESDGDTNRIMVAIKNQLQKDKEQILEAIMSREEAELRSAHTSIRHALDDLEWWIQEKRTGEVIKPTFNVLDLSKKLGITDLSIKSRHYQSAMRRFLEAFGIAASIFLNKKNSGEMRLKALEIRLFSIAIADQNWQDRRVWFRKWMIELDLLFNDKELTDLAFQKQSIISTLLEQGAKEARTRAHCVMRSLIDIITQMVIEDNKNIADARDLTRFINEHIKGFIVIDPSKPALHACSIYDPKLGIEPDQMLTPEFGIYDNMVSFISPAERGKPRCIFTSLTKVRGHRGEVVFFAIDNKGQIVRIRNFGVNSRLEPFLNLSTTPKRWRCVKVWYNGRLCALARDNDRAIHIFDINDSKSIEEIPYPPKHGNYDFALEPNEDGKLILYGRSQGVIARYTKLVWNVEKKIWDVEKNETTKVSKVYRQIKLDESSIYFQKPCNGYEIIFCARDIKL